MAARGIALHKVPHIPMNLASAALEWSLLFMLFVHAIFSYLITKFAFYCKLQVPCLLCSRLDHVFGCKKLGFYWDLVCRHHKFEISSLVLCHVHNKLVDVHGMCENCLFSFATINKSNAETYRLLVGKLGEDPQLSLDEDPLLEDHSRGDFSKRICACCNEPWVLRNHARNLLQTRLDFNDLKKSRKGSMGDRKGFNPLPFVEYKEVKNSSDTESEVPFSNDDDGISHIHETVDLRKECILQNMTLEPHIATPADDLISEKLIHTDSTSELSILDSQGLIGNLGPGGSAHSFGHGLEEISWNSVGLKVDAFPAVVHSSSSVEVPRSSKVIITAVEESKEFVDGAETKPIIEHATNSDLPTALNEKVTERVELEQISGKKVTDEETKPIIECESSSEIQAVVNEKVRETVELDKVSDIKVSDEEKKPVMERELSSEIPSVVNDANSHVPDSLELGDAYKLAVGNNRRQLSGKLLEQMSLKDSTRISEDLKLLLSQISAARGIDLPLNDQSPRLAGNVDDIKTDSSNATGLQILQNRISLERNESGLSLDGSGIGDIEGESEVDRLKRQVEHDKRLMGALYKELEEERSASAIAANQAMAMITRLQEEKAALQMEALQCVRMMEEQAEYDVEALQKANDLLAEKEKELQDLEADLEFLRNKLEDASMLDREMESTCGLEAREVTVEQSDSNHFKSSENVESNSTVDKPHAFSKDNLMYNLYSEFEDERLYILECLKKLEKKLILFSDDGVNSDVVDSVSSHVIDRKVDDLKELNSKEGTQEISSREEVNDLSAQNSEFVGKTSMGFGCGVQCYSLISRMPDAVAIGDAISNLINKLEALEAGHNDIDHSFKSLKRGDEELDRHSDDSSAQGTLRG